VTVEIVSAARAADAAARVRASSRVAIDTEFHAENRYLPDLFLVQVGLDDGSCLLLDPLVPGVLGAVADALRERPWVVHAGDHDLRLLAQALGGPPAAGVFDTQIAAGLASTAWPAGYATLCEGWLGQVVDKGETLSDWSRRPLTAAQLQYAARDVQHLFPLADALQARLVELGRAELARDAMSEAVAVALDPPPERWLSEITPHGTSLDPRQSAVLRALLVWRDERARAQNAPPRVIAGDGVLLDLARRLPRTDAELVASRRFPRNVARSAAELRAVITAALDAPPETWPRLVRRGTADARRSSFLQLWGQVLGERRQWAASLVLPRDVADRLASGGTCAPWRRSLLEPDLDAALSGVSSLRLAHADVVEDP
jgi:ribonuclease D